MEPDVRTLLIDLAETQIPSASPMSPRTRGRARRRRVVVASATVVAAAAVSLGGWAGIDALTHRRVVPPASANGFTIIPLERGKQMSVLTTGAGFVWAGGGTVGYRVDADGNVSDFYPGDGPNGTAKIRGIAVDREWAWVTYSVTGGCSIVKEGTGMCAFPMKQGTSRRGKRVFPVPQDGDALAVGYDSAWVGGQTEMYKVTPDGGVTTVPRPGVSKIIDFAPGLFALVELDDGSQGRALLSLDSYSGASKGRLDLPGALRLTSGLGSLWVSAWHRGEALLYQVSPNTLTILRTIRLMKGGGTPTIVKGMAFSGTTVYAAAARGDEGIVYTVDVRFGDVTGNFAAPDVPDGAVVAFDSLWILHSNPARLARRDIPSPRANHPTPQSSSEQQGLVPQRPGLLYPKASPIQRFELHPDLRTLRVAFTGGSHPCGTLDHVQIIERADSVIILLITGLDQVQEPPPNTGCKGIGFLRHTFVELRNPGGGKVLLDGYSLKSPPGN